MKPVTVVKADGSAQPFKVEKLETSLRRAGATPDEVRAVVETVTSELEDGVTTEAIYRRAFELLRREPEPVAARYSLRRALFGLGPTGFPFEDYLAELFRADGYTVTTRALLKGKCVEHEVDVIAEKDGEARVIEAKFHAAPGVKSDLQVLLYSHARFLDLTGSTFGNSRITGGMVVTNTKFTSVALDYAACTGIDVVSWNHPKDRSLQAWIERTKLYPVTVLASLSNREKAALLSQGTVLCGDVAQNRATLSAAGVAAEHIEPALAESVKLCAVDAGGIIASH